MGSYYKQQLNDWVNTIEVKANVLLDIGGAQNPLKGRTKSWDVQDYKIVDLPQPHVELQKPDLVQDLNFPFNTDEFKDYIGKVDWIYNLGVFDYVIDPPNAFEIMHKLMCEGGHAWVEFPFSYCHHNPIEVDGLRYTWPSIVNLSRNAGFEIEDMWQRTPRPGNNHLLQYYQEDGMRMAPNFDHNVIGYMVLLKK